MDAGYARAIMGLMNQNVRNAILVAVLLLGMGIVWFVVAGIPMIQRSVSSVQTTVSSTVNALSATIGTATSSSVPISVVRTLTIPPELTSVSSSTIRVIIEEDSARWRQQADKRIECMISHDRITVQPGPAVTAEIAEQINRFLPIYFRNLMAEAAKTPQDAPAALQECLELAALHTDGNPYQQNEYASADVLWNKAPYLSLALRYSSTVSDATERREGLTYAVIDVRTGRDVNVIDLIRPESTLTFYRRIAQGVMKYRADLEGDPWRQDPIGWNAEVMNEMERLANGSDQQAKAALDRLRQLFKIYMRYGLNSDEILLYFPRATLMDDYEGALELELPAARVYDIATPDLQAAWGPK